ncbi:MAG: hypothetical protein F4Y00_08695 [Bacteroidetes bacterium SB0662_bin_6]|nr:hypothetical protein [Bacteroidetes bacterium SB0668_bin_1]MYE05030.1 hypothetical protein [Bacteroidetes bacterium SB0662_bin_6]
MTTDTTNPRTGVRYQADESPPTTLSFGLGFQLAVLCIAGIVFTPMIVIRAAGGTETFLSWAVFAAVMISGITTIMQAVRFGRIGAGYVLLMGTSGAFIAVCITALVEGGPAMLATLVIISSLFQFALAARLSLFRRILTPTVTGTVVMLIAVTVMPIIFDMLHEVPEGSPEMAAPMTALATILCISGIALKAKGTLRLWAPVIGVIAGSVVGGFYGLYDTARIAEASWIGFPQSGWPGMDLSFGPVFWTLLPAFVFVTLIGAIETVGDAVAIQRVSWRTPRAVDFRAVQGAVAADGFGNLLSGLAGTVPNTTYSTSVAVTELTGVGARRVGVAVGILFIVLAFLPKAIAGVLAIPSPVAAAYIAVLLAMLFVVGMRIVVQDGIDYRKSLVVGVAFWAGVGFQNGVIFPEYFAEFAGGIFQNGMTAGGLVAILMTLFMELTERRPSRMEAAFDISALPEIRKFLVTFTSRSGWDRAMGERLEAAAEETLLTLFDRDEGKEKDGQRRLLLAARKESDEAILEFVASSGEENLQDQMALLGEQTAGAPVEREISLRLLRHVASSVRHQIYHDTDIVTVHVKTP